MIYISSLCSIDELLFPSISIFSFHLYLSIYSSVSQIIKELLSSSSSSSFFHFRHLSFKNIMKEAISSQNMTNPISFLRRILFRSVFFSPIRSRTLSLVTFSYHFIFSILLQQHISKLSKHFCSNFLSVQISEQYKAMLQI